MSLAGITTSILIYIHPNYKKNTDVFEFVFKPLFGILKNNIVQASLSR